MMKMIKLYLLIIIIVFGTQLAACASRPEVRPNEGLPESESLEEEEAPLEETGLPEVFQGDYEFTMIAKVKGLVNMETFDTMDSTWTGPFTIDSNGQIKGQGTFTYDAKIYSVDEDKCGYEWPQIGTFYFSLGGKVHLEGDVMTIPIKLLSPTLKGSKTTGPYATCDDPGYWRLEGPTLKYITQNRDALIDTTIVYILTKIGNQLKADERLITEMGGVNYDILIKYISPSVIPLVP